MALLTKGSQVYARTATEEDDAYLLAAMLPIYAKVRVLKGGKGQKEKRPSVGWPLYRRVTFKQEVTRMGGVWNMVYGCARQELEHLFSTERARLVAGVGEVFQGFHYNFNMMCEAKECTNPTELNLRDLLKANLDEAEKHLRGPMQEAVDALQRDFKGV